MFFLGELKRRKVLQVGVAYLAAGWVLIEVMTAIEEPLSLPSWADTLVIVLVALGFPLALILAWAFDLKVSRDPAKERGASQPDATRAAGQPATRTSDDVIPNSVAVLAFENLSLEPKDAFFAVGIHEAILNELARIKGISVMSRTSVLRFADGKTPIEQIATELRVQTVVEGSVQYADDRVRITAQLVDASTCAHLWSESYDRQFSDIFAIQTDIATRIASALKAELTPSERETLAEIPTTSPEAYAFYLRAIAQPAMMGGLEVTPEQSATFHRNLDRALELDTEFSLAYAAKAREYAYSMARAVRRDDELTIENRYELAQKNAERALSLDRDSALAFSALGVAHRFAHRDEAAEEALGRALELNPRDARVLRDLAFFRIARGRLPEAVEIARNIVDIDPATGHYLLAHAAQYTKELDEGQTEIQMVLVLAPNFAIGHMTAGLIEAAKGGKSAAYRSLQLAETLGIRDLGPPSLAQVALGYQAIGHSTDARRLVEEFELLAKEYIVGDAIWTIAHLAAGDWDKALRSMERAAGRRAAGVDIFEARVAFNIFALPELEQKEFLAARKRLGFESLNSSATG